MEGDTLVLSETGSGSCLGGRCEKTITKIRGTFAKNKIVPEGLTQVRGLIEKPGPGPPELVQ